MLRSSILLLSLISVAPSTYSMQNVPRSVSSTRAPSNGAPARGDYSSMSNIQQASIPYALHPYCSNHPLDIAIENGDLEAIKNTFSSWLTIFNDNHHANIDRALGYAVQFNPEITGQLVEFLLSKAHGCSLAQPTHILHTALDNKHVAVIKYAKQEFPELVRNATLSAILNPEKAHWISTLGKAGVTLEDEDLLKIGLDSFKELKKSAFPALASVFSKIEKFTTRYAEELKKREEAKRESEQPATRITMNDGPANQETMRTADQSMIALCTIGCPVALLASLLYCSKYFHEDEIIKEKII